MQRSPVNFWLLFAATLSVDAVAVSWAYATTLNRTEELYFGLACSQLSLVCIRTYFSRLSRAWNSLTPFLVALAAAGLTSWLYSLETRVGADSYHIAMMYLSLWIPQVALLIVGLWMLQQTSLAARWEPRLAGNWRFAISHLLVVMTIVAITLVVMRQAKFVHDEWIHLVMWILNNVGFAVAAVVIQSIRWHALLRLAATAAVGLFFAFLFAFFGIGGEPLAINLIQGLILFVWLEFGQILPQRASWNNDGAANEATRIEPDRKA